MKSAERIPTLLSIEQYLAFEEKAQIRHEYLGGVIYGMAGASNAHITVSSNVLIALGARLRGKRCRALNSDTKIRIRFADHTRFYYPDVSVVCQQNAPTDVFQDWPAVIVEVISESTRRTDEFEKRQAYLTIPSLSVYVILEQSCAKAVVWRRTPEGFVAEQHDGMDAVIALPEIEAELPLAEAYEGVEFQPETPVE